MSSSGFSATSGSRLFWIMRNAASCGHARQPSAVPRGARTTRLATVMRSIVRAGTRRELRSAVAPGLVVVLDPHRLHERFDDGRSDEAEAALLKIAGERDVVVERPDVAVQRPELVADRGKRP